MNNPKVYNTKQKCIIKEFFKSQKQNYFTIEQLIENLVSNNKLSKATLYRTLDLMINQGEIVKYYLDTKTPCYQYRDTNDFILFKCNNCGNTIDIPNKLINNATKKINSEYGISIDSNLMILYGKCKKCKEDK